MVAAKRGDVVVIAETVKCWGTGSQPDTSFESVSVGVVASITRDGLVKAWRRAGEESQPCRVPDRARVLLVPQGDVCVPAVLAMAATHDTGELGYASSYRSLDAVRADMRVCRTGDVVAWGGIEAAAQFWTATRSAWDEYHAGELRASVALRDAGYDTREGREAHNRITREYMAAHTAAQIAAAGAFRDAVSRVAAAA